MTVTLKNISKRMLSFDLAGEEFRNLGPPFGYRRHNSQQAHVTRAGHQGFRKQRKSIPSSITLAVGETLSGLPEAVLRVAGVAQALAARDLTSMVDKAPVLAVVTPSPKEPAVKTKKSVLDAVKA